jgi:hypothetical protein
MSDDDFVPAIDSGPDTETVGEPSDGVALEPREVVRSRGMKESTRKLFQAAAEKIKPQLESGDGFDDLEPAIAHDDEKPVAAAASTAASKQTPASSPAAAAPAQDPVAQVVDARVTAQIEMREKALAEREAELTKRATELEARENGRDRYLDNPGATIRDLIKEWTGASTDDEVKDEIADLITELSNTGLGLPVPEQHKLRLDSRKAIRQVKAYKAEQAKRELDMQKKARDAEAEQDRRARVSDIERAFGADEIKAKYPHLVVADGGAEALYDAYQLKKTSTGSEPDWEEVAALANEFFKKKHDDWIARRRHLLAPAAPQAPVVASAPQGDPQSRRSSTLTNKTAAPVPPASSTDEAGFDRDAHRRRSLHSLRAAMKETTP